MERCAPGKGSTNISVAYTNPYPHFHAFPPIFSFLLAVMFLDMKPIGVPIYFEEK